MNALLKKAIVAALEAGQEILRIYNAPDADFAIECKADNSPLTIADRISNEIITKHLSPTPYLIISEENQTIPFDVRKQWSTVWIVDPLDGTKEFIKRNGEFTVNIALVHQGTPILGVIYIPVKQLLYYGELSHGAFKVENIIYSETINANLFQQNAQQLPLKRNTSTCMVVTSRSHMNTETEEFIHKLQKEKEKVEFTSIGSSIKICLIAEGTANIYPRFAPTMEWDTAAGHAIAKAAGKELYQRDEVTPLHYNKENLLNPWFIAK